MRRLVGVGLLLLTGLTNAEEPGAMAPPPLVTWPEDLGTRAPTVWPAAEPAAEGVEALYYDSVPYHGRPTRVFAYLGLPPAPADGKPVPAMVLVSGGGASALAHWVRLWNAKGYAAISMDVCGAVPGPNPEWPIPDGHPRHEHGGPSGWWGKAQIDEPLEDQWPYHAAAAALRARALLAARPEVDAERIGITGVSWGAVTLLWAATGAEWACAVPVYGSGFLQDTWLGPDSKDADGRKWLAQWDPSRYLPSARVGAWLWITSPADPAFYLEAVRASYRLTPERRWLCIKPDLFHGHGGPGENQPEIFAFVDHALRGTPALPVPAAPTLADGYAATVWKPGLTIAQAQLVWTAEAVDGPGRTWCLSPATVDGASARAEVPAAAASWYINLKDNQGRISSTEHSDRQP